MDARPVSHRPTGSPGARAWWATSGALSAVRCPAPRLRGLDLVPGPGDHTSGASAEAGGTRWSARRRHPSGLKTCLERGNRDQGGAGSAAARSRGADRFLRGPRCARCELSGKVRLPLAQRSRHFVVGLVAAVRGHAGGVADEGLPPEGPARGSCSGQMRRWGRRRMAARLFSWAVVARGSTETQTWSLASAWRQTNPFWQVSGPNAPSAGTVNAASVEAGCSTVASPAVG